jgi:hypothetical protein
MVDEWFAEQRTGFIGKITDARRRLAAAPSQGKKLALQAMADAVGEIRAVLKRPTDEVVRDIVDKHGLSLH